MATQKKFVDLAGLTQFLADLKAKYADNSSSAYSVKYAQGADKLNTARNFSITGDATASAVSFDGTSNVALDLSINAKAISATELADAVNTDIAAGVAAKAVTDALYVNGVQVVKSGAKYEAVVDGGDIALTGYTKAASADAIEATDTINEAIGKLEKGLEDVGGDAIVQVNAGNGIAVTEKVDHEQTVSVKIADNDKVLSASSAGLASTLSINYVSADRKIYLKGVNDVAIGEVDCTDFIKDGMLYDQVVATATAASQEITFPKGDKHTYTDLTSGRTYIFLEFNNDGTKSYDKLDATQLVDVYAAGDGLQLDDHEFSIKMNGASAYLSVGTDGVAFDDAAVASMVDGKINALDATVRGNLDSSDAIVTGKKVGVKVVEENGKLTGVTVVENDIASAQGLADEISRATGAESDLAEDISDEVTRATGEEARIEGLVTTEASTARAAEEALDDRLDIIEGPDTQDGSIAKAEKDAKAYADGLNTTMDARVDALELTDHTHANKDELDLIASGDKSKWDTATTTVNKLDGAVTVEGSVKKQIKDAVDALDVATVAGDYVASISETDGKIAPVMGTKGTITSGSTGLVDGGTVYTAIDAIPEMVAYTNAEIDTIFA